MIIPQQLACPRCACLLAYIDTDVLKKCPGCGTIFDEQTSPVLPKAHKYASLEQEVEPHGCLRLLFGYLAISTAGVVVSNSLSSGAILEILLLALWSFGFAARPRQSWRDFILRGVGYFAFFLSLGWLLINAHYVFAVAGIAVVAAVIWWAVKHLRAR